MTYTVRGAGLVFEVDVIEVAGATRVRVTPVGGSGKEYDVGWAAALGRSHRTLEWDGRRRLVVVEPEGDILGVTLGIDHLDLQVEAARRGPSRGRGQAHAAETVDIRAPMPGLVVAVEVEPGKSVAPGATVAVIEAMKMQMELRAPAAGVVRQVRVAPGQEVGAGDVIAVLTPGHAGPPDR